MAWATSKWNQLNQTGNADPQTADGPYPAGHAEIESRESEEHVLNSVGLQLVTISTVKSCARNCEPRRLGVFISPPRVTSAFQAATPSLE
jgi:hypothetical protein